MAQWKRVSHKWEDPQFEPGCQLKVTAAIFFAFEAIVHDKFEVAPQLFCFEINQSTTTKSVSNDDEMKDVLFLIREVVHDITID